MTACKYSSFTLDLGGVLLSTPTVPAGLSPRQIKDALYSPTWHEYETVKIHRRRTATTGWSRRLALMCRSGQRPYSKLTVRQEPNTELISAIQQLKSMYKDLGVFCLSKFSKPALRLLQETIMSWSIVDELYTSATSGLRASPTRPPSVLSELHVQHTRVLHLRRRPRRECH